MECPYCGDHNIQGADLCESCGSDLAGLDIPAEERGFVGRLLSDELRQLPLSRPLVVGPGTTVSAAIGKMREGRHGCVLVLEGDELVGIFTERDVLARVLRRELDPASTPVADVMTSDPVVLEPGDPPAFAIHRMVAQGFRHLPIVEEGSVVGFASVRNVLRYLHRDVIG